MPDVIALVLAMLCVFFCIPCFAEELKGWGSFFLGAGIALVVWFIAAHCLERTVTKTQVLTPWAIQSANGTIKVVMFDDKFINVTERLKVEVPEGARIKVEKISPWKIGMLLVDSEKDSIRVSVEASP